MYQKQFFSSSSFIENYKNEIHAWRVVYDEKGYFNIYTIISTKKFFPCRGLKINHFQSWMQEELLKLQYLCSNYC